MAVFPSPGLTSPSLPVLNEVDPRQGTLDLSIDPASLAPLVIRRADVAPIHDWFRRAARHFGTCDSTEVFKSGTVFYQSVRVILLLEKKYYLSEKEPAETMKKIVKELQSSSSIDYSSNIYPFLAKINAKANKDIKKGYAPEILLDKIKDRHYSISVIGLISKVVIEVFIGTYGETSSLINSFAGYGDHGKILRDCVEGIGVKFDSEYNPIYPIKHGSETILEMKMPGISSYQLFGEMEIQSTWSDPAEMENTLAARLPGFNLTCAKLSPELESTVENPSEALLKFQENIKAKHLLTPFPAYPPTSIPKKLEELAEYSIGNFKKVKQQVISVKCSKDLAEDKINDLCELTEMTRKSMDTFLKAKVASGFPAGKLTELLFTSNVFSLAKKLGLMLAEEKQVAVAS